MHIPLNPHKLFGQRGDTLVEVLIAIAVVSLVLGGAYVTTNRSLLATRAAQERGVALKLAESQLERLKALAAERPQDVFGGGGPPVPSPFCMSTLGTVVAATHDDCALGTSGLHTDDEPVFHIEIVRTGNTFTLTERWADVGGRNIDQLQLSYRLYE